MSNARAVTDLLTDAQRLVHVVEPLVQRTDLPPQTGQCMVNPRGHQPVAGSLAVGQGLLVASQGLPGAAQAAVDFC